MRWTSHCVVRSLVVVCWDPPRGSALPPPSGRPGSTCATLAPSRSRSTGRSATGLRQRSISSSKSSTTSRRRRPTGKLTSSATTPTPTTRNSWRISPPTPCPDIFVNADVYTKPFFEAGLTADLVPYAEKTGFDLSSFDPKFLDLARFEDKVGFLPRAADVVVTYYNKRMFDEAGVAYPTDAWTVQDMTAAAEKLTIKAADGTTTQYGGSADYTWWAYWVPLVVAEGGQILNEDNTEAIFDSPEGIRAWDIIFSNLKNGWFVPPSVQQTMGGPYVPFANGTAAMTFTIRGLTPSFREQLTDDWDVALCPLRLCHSQLRYGHDGLRHVSQVEGPGRHLGAPPVHLHRRHEGLYGDLPVGSTHLRPSTTILPGRTSPAHPTPMTSSSRLLTSPCSRHRSRSTPPARSSKAMEDGLEAVLLDQMTSEQAVQRMAQEATRSLQQQ